MSKFNRQQAAQSVGAIAQPQPPQNGLPLSVAATQPLPKPGLVLTPCCKTCPCWHQSSGPTQTDTCRRYPPSYSTFAPGNRSWPHTNGTDWCYEHPELAAQLQGLVEA